MGKKKQAFVQSVPKSPRPNLPDYKLKGKLCKTKTKDCDCLTSEEINSAEKLWIRHVQKTLFHEKTFTQTKVNLRLLMMKVF